MSRLDELIAELCPDGVEYISIGSVVNYEQPSKYIVKSTDYNDDFLTPVLTAGQSFILGYTNEKDNLFSATKEKPVIIFDDFTGAFKWVDFPFKVKSSAMKMLTVNAEKTTLRYIYHIMGNIGYSSDEHKRLWISIYSEIKIPVPPLPVQSEIVRILDNFTELTTELTAELELRKKQSKFYEYELLKFSDVRYMKIGDCCRVEKGKTPIQKSIPGEFPLVATTENRQSSNSYQFDCAAVCVPLISSRGHGVASLSRIYYQDGKFALGNILCAIIPNDKEELSAEFLRYYLFAKKDTLLVPLMKGGANVALTTDSLKSVNIPIPPMKFQLSLIRKLKKFDVLLNDKLVGLPAEIEARKQQYEYYRDKLLTFKELSA